MRTVTFLFATGLLCAQSGDWLLTTTEFGAPQYQRIDFKFEGEKITGRAGKPPVFDPCQCALLSRA